MSISIGLGFAERGWLPTVIERYGIRGLLRQRISDLGSEGAEQKLIEKLLQSPIALETETANEQHYELPPEFFEIVLGPHLKYSSAYWPKNVTDLGAAEESMLELTCERAELADDLDILELGCGWGSLSLFMAKLYPNSRITVVSNSAPQRQYIEAKAPDNLSVITADMNDFTIDKRFDRVVSIEMFEHMRNYRELFKRIANWVKPDGKLFVHVFCHKSHSYEFETEGAGNWMGRYFFTAGLMPSYDLLTKFEQDFRLEDRWPVSGKHYQRTAAAWRQNIERNRGTVANVFKSVYGTDATKWFHRWRLFFLACEELFGYRGGEEWLVGHYRFTPTQDAVFA
jgi:cyclopropane-fatty-acyl-phospholipid synthase